MENHHQNRMSNCNDRLFLPAAGNQPIVKCGQIRPSLLNGRPTGFDQISTQPWVSLSSFSAFSFPGTLVVPRTKSRPRRCMPMAGETVHVYPHLRQNSLGHSLINSGDQVHQFYFPRKSEDAVAHPLTDSLDGFVQEVKMGKNFSHHEPMVRSETPLQGFLQLRQLLAQSALGQLRQHLRICASRHQGLQHRPSGNPHHIGSHGSKFDIGPFQKLLQSLDLSHSFIGQGFAIPRQIPKVPDGLRRNETPSQQSRESRSAIHPQSFTSVFRPGTLLIWAALTNKILESSSKRLKTGLQ